MIARSTTKLDLLLLGMLMERPMHGWEQFRRIQAEGVEEWLRVSFAGVYYRLGKLHEQELVAKAWEQKGRRTPKSVYRLTEKGRAAFYATLEAKAVRTERPNLDYGIVIFLLDKLPPQRAIALLKQRQAFLAEQAQELEIAMSRELEIGGSPQRLAIQHHRRRFLEMEQDWLTDVISSIQREDEADCAE